MQIPYICLANHLKDKTWKIIESNMALLGVHCTIKPIWALSGPYILELLPALHLNTKVLLGKADVIKHFIYLSIPNGIHIYICLATG